VPRLNILPQRIPAGIAERIGRSVGGLGVTPNMISLIGLAGNALAAYLVVREALLAAGIVYLVFSALDFVDGAVARATNKATPFGAVFDAVLDRVSEALLLAACAWYFGDRGEYVQAGVAYAALFGSVAVSYMRARAEAMGLSMRDGFFRRQERVVLVGVGLLFNGLTVIIWPLAVLSNVTALQRFWLIGKGLRELDEVEPAGRG
jgi:CDP-diacylglycerol--glycerol-3-phosphate 3-phosphatidyltransferase